MVKNCNNKKEIKDDALFFVWHFCPLIPFTHEIEILGDVKHNNAHAQDLTCGKL